MKRRRRRRVYFQKEKAEIDEDYEYNTGRIIAEYFKDTERSGSGVSENLAQTEHYLAVPCALCKNHGPFTWGKTPHEAVYHAVVLEEVAKMAARTEAINAKAADAPQILQDKHYLPSTVKTYITGKQKNRRYRKRSSGRPERKTPDKELLWNALKFFKLQLKLYFRVFRGFTFI